MPQGETLQYDALHNSCFKKGRETQSLPVVISFVVFKNVAAPPVFAKYCLTAAGAPAVPARPGGVRLRAAPLPFQFAGR
jgi:hypothetical protein